MVTKEQLYNRIYDNYKRDNPKNLGNARACIIIVDEETLTELHEAPYADEVDDFNNIKY